MEDLKPRAVDRVETHFEAYLRFDRTPELPVVVRDFSSQGFSCRSADLLAIGSRVILRVPKVGQFSAKISWQLGSYAGARFDAPLPLPTVINIVLPGMRVDEDSDAPVPANLD